MIVKRIYSTDEMIVNGIRDSDNEALKHVYKVSYPVIRGMIMKNSGTEDDAHDIFQEAVIIFYEKTKEDTFKITCSITTFLYSVSRNLWLKNLKRNRMNISLTETHEVIDINNDDSIDRESKMSENQKLLLVY